MSHKLLMTVAMLGGRADLIGDYRDPRGPERAARVAARTRTLRGIFSA